MPEQIEISALLQLKKSIPVIDVRSEGEYAHAHIPDAVSIPLFTNDERAIIGTLYKQHGKEKAVEKGLELVGPKLIQLVSHAKLIAGTEKKVIVHCWRGGMRSGSVAWLLETSGLQVYILKGGYKTYRTFVLDVFTQSFPFQVIGGYTGSAKTFILQALKEQGEQVIDLEALAHHKGSAFGALGEMNQPQNEMVENLLADQLLSLDKTRKIWVEDESKNIGKVFLNPVFYSQLKISRTLFLQRSKAIRIKHLVNLYGQYPKSELEASILKIQKRLGNEVTRKIIDALHTNQLDVVCDQVLNYYDKSYRLLIDKRDPEHVINIDIPDDWSNEQIANFIKENYGK